MDILRAERITMAGRRGSSRPIVADTRAGERIVKLRGAGQGTGALVAEIIVAELAEAIGLSVPPRSLVTLPDKIETADWDDELDDLLKASVGINLGFDFLRGATDLSLADASRVPAETQALIFWLDRFVMNPDRTAQNPNLLWWSDHLWLIDHGAALGFQYDWERVSETSTRDARLPRDAHLFEATLTAADVALADEAASAAITRDVLARSVEAVHESFIIPLLSGNPYPSTAAPLVERRRAAFLAYLWKRIQAPTSFLELRPSVSFPKRGPPAWLKRP